MKVIASYMWTHYYFLITGFILWQRNCLSIFVMYYYAISLAIPCQLQLAIANSNYFLLNEIKTYQSGKGDKRD